MMSGETSVSSMKISRIHITGNAGAGKTTMSKQLGDETGLPVYGLDSIVWEARWKKRPKDERYALEDELISQTNWIIEGVSDRVRRAADLVIFLDRSRPKCLIRCFKRSLPYLLHSRPELPDDCPELLIIPKLLEIIWKFPSGVREKIIRDGQESDKLNYFKRLTTDLEIDEFVSSFNLMYDHNDDFSRQAGQVT